KQFESLFNEENKQLKVYYLDLLNFREVSSKLSEDFQVIHESPQLLVIKMKFLSIMSLIMRLLK
ncbi:MAG: monothiol bacilliredoxin BrxC family protein, partial [Flavobacteriales bacterium]